MPFVRAGDIVVSYEMRGPQDAPVVVLANSLGTNFHLWDEQIEALATTLRVLRYDMRGHGLTEIGDTSADGAFTMTQLAGDVAALLDALEIDRVRFMGLSIGGMVGQRFAATYSARVEALVLCATASRIGEAAVWNERVATVRAQGIEALADGVLSRWLTPHTHRTRPELVRGLRTMLTRTTVAGYAGACLAIRDADLRDDDARIAAPTLVVSGSGDAVTPPEAGAALRDAIPNARLVVIDDAAHILALEAPGALEAAVLPFLRGVTSGRRGDTDSSSRPA